MHRDQKSCQIWFKVREKDIERYLKDIRFRRKIDRAMRVPSEVTPGTSMSTSPSAILRAKYEEMGIEIPKGHEAHHIVPHDEPAADRSRVILEMAEIDINSLENSILLPRGKEVGNPFGLTRHEFTFDKPDLEYIGDLNDALWEVAEKDIDGTIISVNPDKVFRVLERVRRALGGGD